MERQAGSAMCVPSLVIFEKSLHVHNEVVGGVLEDPCFLLSCSLLLISCVSALDSLPSDTIGPFDI